MAKKPTVAGTNVKPGGLKPVTPPDPARPLPPPLPAPHWSKTK
jgi:hypothetical protein